MIKITPIKNKYSGIALIQILIITAILSTIALYVTYSAQQQIQVAQWANDKTQAKVNLHSARADIIFKLLTEDWGQTTSVNQAGPSQWNLYNQPFTLNENDVNNTQIQLQDQAGLINLHYPQSGIITKRLELLGLKQFEAKRAEGILLDWQDHDSIHSAFGREIKAARNASMPDIREWLLQNVMTQEQLLLIEPDFTLYGTSHINLMTSPYTILASLLNEAVAAEVINLRDNGELTKVKMTNLSSSLAELDVFLSPATSLSITLKTNYNEAQAKQKLFIKFNPYSTGEQLPYNILQTIGG